MNGAQQKVDGKHHALEANADKKAGAQGLGRLHAKEQAKDENDDGQHNGGAHIDKFFKERKCDIHEVHLLAMERAFSRARRNAMCGYSAWTFLSSSTKSDSHLSLLMPEISGKTLRNGRSSGLR